MKILFVARQPPVALDNGSRIRTHALVCELAARARVELLAFDTQPGSTMAHETCERVLEALPAVERVTLIAPRRASKRRLQLQTLAGGGSYLLRQHRSAAMSAALAQSVERFRPDLVHFDNLMLGEFAPEVKGPALRAIAPENVDSMLLRRMAETTDSRLRSLLYRREARLLARWEASHLRDFDLCVAVSEEDRRWFAALGANALCIPNGVARHAPPPPLRPLAHGRPLRLLFVGSGSYEPNRTGVAWFVEHVLPLARCRSQPQLTLVGSGWEAFAERGCRVAGHVASLEPLYASHDVALVPLLSGGGSRLKVAEALAKGVPLLGTKVGLEGYPLSFEHALIADTPQGLAAQLEWLERSLIDDLDAVQRQVSAGFRLVEDFFWDEIGARLADAYSAALARSRHGAARRGLAPRRPGEQARETQRVLRA